MQMFLFLGKEKLDLNLIILLVLFWLVWSFEYRDSKSRILIYMFVLLELEED